ncbi:MAG: histidine kinase [Burkholderiales bacterium]
MATPPPTFAPPAAAPFARWSGRGPSLLDALRQFRWRLVFALALAAAAATEVLAQPSVFEYWSLPAVIAGLADYYLQCLGYVIGMLLAVTVAERYLRRLPVIARPVAVVFALALGAFAGGLLDVWLHDLDASYLQGPRFVGDALRWLVIGMAVVGIYTYQVRAAGAAARVHRAAVERVAVDRQLLEARLQVMRAQIEPHFLFNSLANVKRLGQSDVARGVTMLDNLVRYLRAALPQIRAASTTLGQEADLVQAYLDVLQIRMGAYLSFAVDVPAPLREHPFPPMMLLTLAENAIKHGLAPSPEAGRIDIRARHAGDALVVTVADTGVGFGAAKTGGTGIGLANTRARLAALYGPEAALDLAANEPRGVVASIRIPLARLAEGAAAPQPA